YLRELWRRHAGEIAELRDDAVERRQAGRERGEALVEYFLELLGWQVAGSAQVIGGNPQREQRILQLVGEAPGQLAPGRDALGLHETLALIHELRRHAVEGRRQLANLARRADVVHAHIPAAGAHV